jgi:anaerobic magnesium-protoporphyrin IX monomethyl ester cyclase
MDILLTHGYFLYDDPHERQIMKPYPPLGILYLSSYLKKADFAVGVYDTTFSDMAQFMAYITANKPPIVGLYVNMMTKKNALKMITFCKQNGCKVVLGGPEPPYYAEQYLRHGADVIVKGEGETALAELIPHLAKHGTQDLHLIKGIAFIGDNDQLIETEARMMMADLSANPWADREAIDLRHYMHIWQTHHGKSSVSVIHARGCPYTCTWCSHSVYGNTHRRRTPDECADELLWIKETYNPDVIWYADDVFGINHKWLFAYAEALKKRNVRIPFECISRADRLNEEVIGVLKEMGCYRLWNGSESGSQKILDAMKRKVDVADVQHKTHLLQNAGIETGMFIMLGYKGETMQDLVDTVQHLKISNPDIFLTTVAYPIKGTAFYAEVEADILTNGHWAETADRDLTVSGRYSKKFYSYATRWMVNEVALNRARKNGGVSPLRRAKMWANTQIGWLGMQLTQHQTEQDGTRLLASSAHVANSS